MKMKKISFIVGTLLFITLNSTFHSCKIEHPLTPEQKVGIALDTFVSKLVLNPPTAADISDRVKEYLQANSATFFGSTVTLLDTLGIATYSPYWYRLNGGLAETDLADPSYHINEQFWLRLPIDKGHSIWTDAYYDSGGGNIWMKTRSVPVFVDGKLIAVATTDLAL
jgi:hypothetical protein